MNIDIISTSATNLKLIYMYLINIFCFKICSAYSRSVMRLNIQCNWKAFHNIKCWHWNFPTISRHINRLAVFVRFVSPTLQWYTQLNNYSSSIHCKVSFGLDWSPYHRTDTISEFTRIWSEWQPLLYAAETIFHSSNFRVKTIFLCQPLRLQ